MNLETFTFTIWYFKPSGKLYTEAVVEWGCRVCDNSTTPYMYDARDRIKSLNIRKKLPGLTGSWEGPILINCEEGFPILILPENNKG